MSSAHQNALMDPEDLFECPFDKTHMIRAKRFQYHVTNCAKNFPNHNLKKCPFNARHYIPKPHLQHHISTCPDRRTIETETEYQNRQGSLNDGSYFGGNVSVPSYNTVYATDETESWDDEATAAPFMWGESNAERPAYERNVTKTDAVFIHPAERSVHDQEIRLPKHRPEVLQNRIAVPPGINRDLTMPNAGFGRGSLAAKAREDKQAALLQSLGRGRGSTIPGMQPYKSLSDVLDPNRRQRSPQNVISSQNNGITTQQPQPGQWNGLGSSDNRLRSESPYSSESESIPDIAKKHAGQGAPRSINAHTTNRFSPNTSCDNSPKPSPSHGRGNMPGWFNKGGTPGFLPASQPGSGSSSGSVPSPKLPVGRGGQSMGRGIFKEPEPVNQMPVLRGIGRAAVRTVTVPIPGVRPLGQEKAFDSTGDNSPCSQSDSDQFESEIEKEKLKDERKKKKVPTATLR